MQSLNALEEGSILNSVRLGRLYREQGRCGLALEEFGKIFSNISHKDNPALHNMILNEIEITQGKRILDSKPRGIAVTLTSRCNIRCIMCGVWQNPWDIPEKTIKEIIEFLPYLQRLFWQGGEAFLSPYFEELFEEIASYPNIRQDINTNGLFINREWAKKLVKANANIIFSIDGITKETYEYIRRGARFEDLLKSVELLNEYMWEARQDITHTGKRSSTIINLVVMRSNYHELEGFIDFAKKYKFDRLQITPVDIGSQENIFLHRDMAALAYIDKIMPKILEKAKTYGIDISNWLPAAGYSRSFQEDAKLFKDGQQINSVGNSSPVAKNNSISCYWPWQFLFIDSGGQVRPQCFCIKEVGNVCNNTIGEIWNSDAMQIYRGKLFDNDYRDWCDYRCATGKISKEALSLD